MATFLTWLTKAPKHNTNPNNPTNQKDTKSVNISDILQEIENGSRAANSQIFDLVLEKLSTATFISPKIAELIGKYREVLFVM